MRTARFLAVVFFVFLGTILSSSPCFASSASKSQPTRRVSKSILSEEFSFTIKDFKVDHQGESVLNVDIKFRYRRNMQSADYPDFHPMVKEVEDFINGYPNETDYWEIVNKKLTQMLLDKYPTLVEVTSRIQISPRPDLPYFRASTTTRVRK